MVLSTDIVICYELLCVFNLIISILGLRHLEFFNKIVFVNLRSESHKSFFCFCDWDFNWAGTGRLMDLKKGTCMLSKGEGYSKKLAFLSSPIAS